MWVRSEVKIGEQRTPITPNDAQVLLESGFKITVEKSPQRCFADDDYAAVGCELVRCLLEFYAYFINRCRRKLALGLQLPILQSFLVKFAFNWYRNSQSDTSLGLKELPEANESDKFGSNNIPGIPCTEFALKHRHLYFAHCFKQQSGWKNLLSRFNKGLVLFSISYQENDLISDRWRVSVGFGVSY